MQPTEIGRCNLKLESALARLRVHISRVADTKFVNTGAKIEKELQRLHVRYRLFEQDHPKLHVRSASVLDFISCQLYKCFLLGMYDSAFLCRDGQKTK